MKTDWDTPFDREHDENPVLVLAVFTLIVLVLYFAVITVGAVR